MSYVTRYQVFLSSTFTDLKEERAEVIQALWELDCIPTGMEAFLASNMSQWDIIQRVIDQCDYYVLIIGGRYGSVTPEGISYTEKEFNYAKAIGLPVLAFAHGEPEQIPVGKTEAEAHLREKLEAFRSRVMNEYPVRTWTNAHQLGSLVSRSLVQEMRRTPRPGWVRNDGSSPILLLERINELTQENLALKDSAGGIVSGLVPLDELASGKDKTTIGGTIELVETVNGSFKSHSRIWESDVSWDKIFRNIGPSLINEATEHTLNVILRKFYQFEEEYPYVNLRVRGSDIYQNDFDGVIVQLRALGLIDKGLKKRGVNDKSSYWRLTDYGDRYLVTLMAKRKGSDNIEKITDDPEFEAALG